MAEPVRLASGLLALATFALQSSIRLYETVQSFHSHTKRVRDLLEELEALSGVLDPLIEMVGVTTDGALSALDLPLLRCGNACGEFEQELLKFSLQSAGSRTGFYDWAKLRYMGDDIEGFRRLLSGYKLTIKIALADANLCKTSITAENVESFKDLISTAKADLEVHFESIDTKLESILWQTVAKSDPDASELRLIKEERLSTEKCLQICARLSEHINQIQLKPERSGSSPVSANVSRNSAEYTEAIGCLYKSCITFYKSLLRILLQGHELSNKEKDLLQSQYQLICLWGNDFGAMEGDLDNRLQNSRQLQTLILSILVSIGEVLAQRLMLYITQTDRVPCHLFPEAGNLNELLVKTRHSLSEQLSGEHGEDDVDQENDSSDFESAFPTDNLNEVIEDLTSYTRNLFDLIPSIECPAKDPEVSKRLLCSGSSKTLADKS